MGALDYQRDEHHLHLIVYHLIWCPTRRRKVLVNQLGKRCEDLMRQQCDEKGWTIVERAVQPDHVQLFVRVWPSGSAADVAKPMWRKSARHSPPSRCARSFRSCIGCPPGGRARIVPAPQATSAARPFNATLRRQVASRGMP